MRIASAHRHAVAALHPMTTPDLDRAIAANPAWAGLTVTARLVVPPVASPMQRGVDHHGWLVEAEPNALWFLKTPGPEAAHFINTAAAMDAATIAGNIGVAPRLLWSDGIAGAWEYLGHPWRTANLSDLAKPQVLPHLIEAKRAVHEGPRFARTRSVFDLVEQYAATAQAVQVVLPTDYPWLLDNVRAIGQAITASGVDTVPCHGDGIASNVMIGPGQAVRLVDWDEAANADPHWDLGSLFAEAFPFDPPAQAALERYAGSCPQSLFARCRLYGIADDLAWGTRSLIAAAVTTRRDVEFFKYAQWRLLRCRMALHDPRFEERLRTV